MTAAETIQNFHSRQKQGQVQTFPAVVQSVDEDKQTCTVVAARNEQLIRVRLKSVINGLESGIYCMPSIGGSVLVSLIGNDKQTAYVSCFGKIDKVIIINESGYRIEMTDEQVNLQVGENVVQMTDEKIYMQVGESTVDISENEIVLNGGELNGLVKHDELKTQLQKNSDAIQAIKDLFANWVPVPQDGGAALKTASAALASKLVGTWDNIENDKIKQG